MEQRLANKEAGREKRRLTSRVWGKKKRKFVHSVVKGAGHIKKKGGEEKEDFCSFSNKRER